MPAVELVAVNQCSGNSRGFFDPRVASGQLANGALGNAKWRGVPLKALLDKAGIDASAKQVTFDGADGPVLPTTPDFVKALDLDHAMDSEVMVAYAMNDADLPMLNGHPVRLVVPGYFGTYWVNHLATINVVDSVYDGFWMKSAYRIPDNPCACVEPGTAPKKTVPINRFTIRSFVTSVADGARVPAGREFEVRGFAFDGGFGIREVALSIDGGKSWVDTTLDADLGKYSFRGFRTRVWLREGEHVLMSRAVNAIGQTQPRSASWNPAGYLRNIVESTRITRGRVVKERAMSVATLPVRTALAAAFALAAACGALATKIELPPETARLANAPGVELANAQCMTCHSVDYVITQPRGKPLAFWKAEVEKMKAVYGAPIPPEDIGPLADYLTRAYGTP
jgi:mono/diheme cytochrome c family protein